MRPRRAFAPLSMSVLSMSVALAACTTAATSPSPTQIAVATLVATAVPDATVSTQASGSPVASGGGTGGQATPGPLDPCTLLTADEASTAVGTKLGAGVSSTVDPLRVCTWKAGLTEVKLLLAPPAPDVATATAYWDLERSQIQADVPVNDISLYDRAAYGTYAQNGVSVSALFVIKGTQFFDFYCGLKACTENASAAAATLIGGRLP